MPRRRVTFVAVGNQLRHQLERKLRSQHRLVTIALLPELDQQLDRNHISTDAFVLGASIQHPIRLVQRIRAVDQDVPIIVLTERSTLPALESSLRFAPFVGSDTFAMALDGHDAIANAIEAHVARHYQRKSYRGVLAAAQSHLGLGQHLRPPITQALDRLLDQAPIGVVNIHSDGTIRSINRRALKMLSANPESAIGSPLVRFFPLYERSRLRRLCSTSELRGNSNPVAILEIFSPGKPRQFLEATGATLLDHMDEVGTTLILQDVTARVRAEMDRQRAEAALIQSQQQYRGLVETMTEAVATYDDKTVLTYVNQRFCDMVGRASGEVLGTSILDFVASNDRQLVDDRINSLRDDEIARFENAWTSKGGHDVYTLTSLRRMVDQNGLLDGSLGVFTDISERRRAENALAESEKQLRLITDAVPQLIAYINTNEQFVFANKAYEEWFHLPRTAIHNQRLVDVIGQDAYAYCVPHLTRAYRGTPVQVECRLSYKTAGPRYVRANYIPDVDQDGVLCGIFLIVGDLTELKRVEEIERQHLLTLCHASRLMLLGEMSSQISHELAQPIASIATHSNACVRLFKTGRVTESAVRESLDDIVTQASRAANIMTRLRGFVRKELAPSEFNIADLIDDVLRFAEGELRTQNVSVALNVRRDLPQLEADRILIEQVLMNLLMNAVEAMHSVPPAKRRLCIEADVQTDDQLVVSVIDAGPGIPEEARSRIFEPFYTTKPQGVGLGLGLVITASILELHGGRIWLDSTVEQGTCVRFTLPCTH